MPSPTLVRTLDSLRPSLDLKFAGESALDYRIAFTRATSAWYFNSAGVLTDAGSGNPRFDYNPSTLSALGLLIEEQRTNSIRAANTSGAVIGSARNVGTITGLTRTASTTVVVASTGHNVAVNDMITVSGANVAAYNGTFIVSAVVAGVSYSYVSPSSATDSATGYTVSVLSPGTAPTGWNLFYSPQGIAKTITAVGTTNGIPSIDIRFAGLAANTFSVFSFEQPATVAGASGENWTHSVFVASVSGAIPRLFTEVRQIGGSYPTSNTETGTLTSNLVRQPSSTLALVASATSVVPTMSFILVNGTFYDFTLRIGAPQLELGAFATSPILSAGAATTRNADVATIGTLTPWFNQSGWSCVIAGQYQSAGNPPVNQVALELSDGTTNNRYTMRRSSASGNLLTDIFVGGVSQGAVGASAPSTSAFKYFFSATQNQFVSILNGGAPVEDTAGNLPTVDRMTIGGLTTGTGQQGNMTISSLTMFPRVLSKSQGQALTT
jgi:hypothetical protein